MNQQTGFRIAAVVCVGWIGTALSQPAPVKADKSVADTAALLAQRKQYAEVLTVEAEKNNERLNAIKQQLQALDKDIESRVDRIVGLLATVKDSTDSRGRVRRSKDKAIQGLRNSISFYVRERDRRNQDRAAGGSSASKEGLAKEVNVIDTRIEKRIDQILSLSKSMTQHEEFNRYERYRNDDYDYNTETKEFRRFEKDVNGSAKSKADVIQELKAGIEKQTREMKDLRDKLLATNDAERKTRIQEQIEEKEEIVANRREQVEELLTAGEPATKPLSNKGAFEIDKLLAEMTLDLQSDFRKFQQLVSEFNEARSRARYSQERLDRFLKDMAPAVAPVR